MDRDRIRQQLQFLNIAEALKLVYRRNRTQDRSRFESSAEHSWHVALMAIVFAEHANESGLDLLKLIQMLLIHDLVEIHAGDTWIFDAASTASQQDREAKAAQALFSHLPADQAEAFRALWRDFEERSSPEAKYAASIDMLQPLANHLLTGHPTDEGPKPTRAQVMQHKSAIAEGSLPLWRLAQALIDQSAEAGLYPDDQMSAPADIGAGESSPTALSSAAMSSCVKRLSGKEK